LHQTHKPNALRQLSTCCVLWLHSPGDSLLYGEVILVELQRANASLRNNTKIEWSWLYPLLSSYFIFIVLASLDSYASNFCCSHCLNCALEVTFSLTHMVNTNECGFGLVIQYQIWSRFQNISRTILRVTSCWLFL
jgi:hypothetical protein